MNSHKKSKEIKKVIDDYAQGTFESDAAKLKNVFHKDAVMNGYLGDDLVLATPQFFIDDMTSGPSMKETGAQYNVEIESVRIEGDIASVIISETGFRGEGKLVNYFHLIRIDGEWKIISKLFTTI